MGKSDRKFKKSDTSAGLGSGSDLKKKQCSELNGQTECSGQHKHLKTAIK